MCCPCLAPPLQATATGGSDAVQVSLPIEGRQPDVWVATSFALRPSGTGNSSRAEGLALPAADPGTGSVVLMAGVGSLPAIQVGSCRSCLHACMIMRIDVGVAYSFMLLHEAAPSPLCWGMSNIQLDGGCYTIPWNVCSPTHLLSM